MTRKTSKVDCRERLDRVSCGCAKPPGGHISDFSEGGGQPRCELLQRAHIRKVGQGDVTDVSPPRATSVKGTATSKVLCLTSHCLGLGTNFSLRMPTHRAIIRDYSNSVFRARDGTSTPASSPELAKSGLANWTITARWPGRTSML